MALVTTRENAATYPKYTMVIRSGTRTAADFEVDIGFRPIKVVVTNLTDKISAQWDHVSGNAKQLVTTDQGVRSYEAGGLAVTGRELAVDISTKGLETDDDVVLIEAWG
jgi:hypothetical protein